LPRALFGLPNLEELDLGRNRFHGTIPTTSGAMPKLMKLKMPLNYLSGSIPFQISSVATLEEIDLRHQFGATPLEGRMPTFANATALHFIDFSNNAIANELPENLLDLSQVQNNEIIINLNNNDITGAIPLSLARFSKLDLRLANNMIESIPIEICLQRGW
jgi:hypothetical protein